MILTTVDEIVTHYGGPRSAARHFGYASHATVIHWKQNQKIPAKLYFRISRELRKQEIEVDERIFDDG